MLGLGFGVQGLGFRVWWRVEGLRWRCLKGGIGKSGPRGVCEGCGLRVWGITGWGFWVCD
jgi:hypothetical protein